MTERDIYEIAARARQAGMCAHVGPPPAPDLPPYMCSLPIDHAGAHLARDIPSGFVYDSWVS